MMKYGAAVVERPRRTADYQSTLAIEPFEVINCKEAGLKINKGSGQKYDDKKEWGQKHAAGMNFSAVFFVVIIFFFLVYLKHLN